MLKRRLEQESSHWRCLNDIPVERLESRLNGFTGDAIKIASR